MTGTDPPLLAPKTVIAYFDPLNVYGDLKAELHKNIPLTNLHWNHPLRPLRSIKTLDVQFLEENAQISAPPKHQMLGLSSAPYLKIIFIKCDDNDTYRSTVRPIIKEWLANSVSSERDPTEWLIVHYIAPGSKVSSGNRFKYGIFDKIKADFNTGTKSDRCIQLRHDYVSEGDCSEAWRHFISKVKDAILEAFSTRVNLYQEEVNKLEAKKHVLGWNFGKFFVMKEGLALAFEKMNLFEDALLLYDELEESFIQISRQKSASFFLSFELHTISLSLLQLQKEDKMRHQILANDISIFDFHCYLFSRQSFLLLCIAEGSSSPSISALKVGELFLRLRSFLTEMNGLLKSNKCSIQAIAEWTFNVSQEFLQACKWIDSGLVREVAEGRGELYIFSRKSLETIAATNKWYIEGVLTEVSLDDSSPEIIDPEFTITNSELASCLESDQVFYSNYKAITEFALAEFDLADRVRTKNRLSSQLALLDYQLGNYKEAAALLESIPNLYSRQGWSLISTSLLLVYVQCLKKLNRREDILINSLELLLRSEYLTTTEISEHVEIVQDLSDSVSYTTALDPYFDCSVYPNISAVGEKDSYCMQVTLKNSLKQDFKFDSATITMRNLKDSTDILSFEVSKENEIIAKDGKTTFCFETHKLVRANFKMTGIFFTRGGLAFTKSFTDESTVIVQLYPSPNNFHAKFCVPPVLDLGERRLGLLLHSGQNVIKHGRIMLKSLSVGLKLMSMKAKVEKQINRDVKITTVEGKPPSITFDDVSPYSNFIVTVPYVIEYDVSHIRLKAIIDYTTKDGETFSYVIDQNLEISLALSVNVQDFYKTDRLFSKFTMSCNNSTEPVRILQATLTSTDEFSITSPFGTSTSHIAYPSGPVSYGFCTRRTEAKTENDVVQLYTRHRYLKDECILLVWKMFSRILKTTEFMKYGLLIESLIYGVQFDTVTYSYTGVVKIPAALLNLMENSDLLKHLPCSDRKDMFQILRENLKNDTMGVELSEEELALVTRDLVIPVSIPQVHVVHTVEMKMPTEDHFVVGKSILVSVSISSYQDWAPLDDSILDCDSQFIYDVAATESWAISGKKKAYFNVSKDEKLIDLALVPLKTGKLSLPKINIQAHESLHSAVSMEINYRNEYQSALVVPEFDRLTLSF